MHRGAYDFINAEFNIAGNDEQFALDWGQYSWTNQLMPPPPSAPANLMSTSTRVDLVKLPRELVYTDFWYRFTPNHNGLNPRSILWRLTRGKSHSDLRHISSSSTPIQADLSPISPHLRNRIGTGVYIRNTPYERPVREYVAKMQKKVDVLKEDCYIFEKVLWQMNLNEEVLRDNLTLLDRCVGVGVGVPSSGLYRDAGEAMKMEVHSDGTLLNEVAFRFGSNNGGGGRRRANSVHTSTYCPNEVTVVLNLSLVRPLNPYTIHEHNATSIRNDTTSRIHLTKRNAEIIQQVLHVLKTRIQQLQVPITEHQRLLSKFNLLNAEVLQRIFWYAVEPREAYVSRVDSMPRVLANVCRAWRHVAYDTPFLWKDAILESGERYTPFLANQLVRLGQWYQRSGNTWPLSLGIFMGAVPLHLQHQALGGKPDVVVLNPCDILKVVYPYRHRLGKLHLSGADAPMVEEMLGVFRGSRLVLRDLVYSFGLTESVRRTLGGLTSLTLKGRTWNVYGYEIRALDPSTVLHILEHCPRLSRCELQHAPVEGRPGRTQEMIRVEVLDSLVVNLDNVAQILRFLVAPRLKRLEVYMSSRARSASLDQVVKEFARRSGLRSKKRSIEHVRARDVGEYRVETYALSVEQYR